MNSGPKWSLRNGSQYQRLCARAGCGAPASVTLRFQPTQRQAWLVELDEHAARTQGDLCNRHAAALVLPRGWELHDERVDAPDVDGDAAPAKNTNGKGVRRVRVRRKGAAAPPSPDPGSLPGLEPAAEVQPPAEPVDERAAPEAPPAAEAPVDDGAVDQAPAAEAPADDGAAPRTPAVPFIANDDEEVEEALGAILDARTPLLQRAFRNSKPL
jgi:Protein of unknown function (DUF3499)